MSGFCLQLQRGLGRVTLGELSSLFDSDISPPGPGEALPVLADLSTESAGIYGAIDNNGQPCLLLTGLTGRTVTFETRSLRFAEIARVRFNLHGEQTTTSAYALTLLDVALADPFAALCAQLRHVLCERADVDAVSKLLGRWRQLFSQGKQVGREQLMGLWGELWVLSRSKRAGDLVRGWRACDAGTVDFFVDGRSLEVKTTSRPGKFHVSQAQTEASAGDGLLAVLPVEECAQGRSINDLVATVALEIPDDGEFYGRLADRGFRFDCQEASCSRFELLGTPVFVPLSRVPRIRAFDPGISNIRYDVALDSDKALDGNALFEALSRFGLDNHR